MDNREALQALNEQLSDPGSSVLYRAQRNKGLGFTAEQVRAFVSQIGAQSTYANPQRSAGKVASEAPKSRFVVDLVDRKDAPVRSMKWIVCVQGVFTRQLYTQATSSKRPEDVAEALRAILARIKDGNGVEGYRYGC